MHTAPCSRKTHSAKRPVTGPEAGSKLHVQNTQIHHLFCHLHQIKCSCRLHDRYTLWFYCITRGATNFELIQLPVFWLRQEKPLSAMLADTTVDFQIGQLGQQLANFHIQLHGQVLGIQRLTA